MSIDITVTGAATVFSPTGRLDSNSTGNAEKIVIGRMDEGASRIVFDFSGLDYISSAGLRLILVAAKRVKAAGGKLAICNMKEHIRDVFEMSGFLSILTVCPDRAEAERAVSA